MITINKLHFSYPKDGFILKIKPTLSQIDRLDKVDPRGDPLYRVLAQPNAKRIPKSKDK